MARYLPRNLRGRNVGIGLLLLVTLYILAGPRTVPQFVSNLLPIDGSCVSLRRPSEPDLHQSLIQREASQRMVPLSVQARVSAQQPDGSYRVTVVLTNMTIGTLPVLIPSDVNSANGRLDIGGTNADGVGVVATSTFTLPVINDTRAPISLDQVRLMVPQQTCSITRVLSAQEAQNAGIRAGAPIVAYYRNSTSGVLTTRSSTTVQPLFGDLGMWTGAVASVPVVVPFVAPTPIAASAGG